jgi:hypothetical protein
MMLTFHDSAGDHPDARAVRDGVFRGLARPESSGLRCAVLDSTREFTVRTPGGLYAGMRLGYTVDLQRLDRVVVRTLRGLYFTEMGYRLPDGFEAVVYSEEGLAGIPPADAESVRTQLVQPALNNTPRTIGNEVLRYWMARARDHDHVTGWVFTFYRRVSFVGFTVPVDRPRFRG